MIMKLYSISCLWLAIQLALLLSLGESQRYNPILDENYPNSVVLRAAVLTSTPPLAYYDENFPTSTAATTSIAASQEEKQVEAFPQYRGYMPDVMRMLISVAKDYDNITLSFEVEEAPPFSYGRQFEYMSNTCNTTKGNPRYWNISWEDCNRLDLIVGDFYGFPTRSVQTLLTPPLLTTAAASVQYTGRQKRQIITLGEAEVLQEPVCLLDESFYNDQVLEKFPAIRMVQCFTHEECVTLLKEEKCALFVDDELQLRYMAVQDVDLQMTPETFDEQYIVWPLNVRLDPTIQQLIIRWIYQAKSSGSLDALYGDYFQVEYCSLGFAGLDCDRPCSPSHGISDRRGNCLCETTRWTGDDCSIEVVEDTHMIPSSMIILAYTMVAVNFFVVAICALWLYCFRNTTQVRISQPMYLSLILLGCLISTSTIIALAQQDDGDGPVPACMAIPWLYSVGFSITFGTLFAKIRHVYKLYKAAVTVDVEECLAPSQQEIFGIVGGILLLDITILLVWTIVDPLEWQRTVETVDKFGYPLSSTGQCICDDWVIFAGIIGSLHLALMLLAVGMCYVSRKIPTQLSESKYLGIAMFSNLQIFVIGLPILVIVGSDPPTSFFVRSSIIWMNDLVVVTVIFGNLMIKRYLESVKVTERDEELEQIARQNYEQKREAAVMDRKEATTLVSNMLLQH